MAKKTKSKMNLTRLVVSIVILALAVLTICTLFMPMFRSFIEGAISGKVTDTGKITGADIFVSAFHGEISSDLSAGANSLIALKIAEETAFVTTVLCWGYVLTLAMAVVAIVFTVLSLLGLRFKLVNTILGAVFALLAIVTFIFAIVVAGKMVNYSGSVVAVKTVITTGAYFLFAGLIASGAQVYLARSK